MISKMNVMSAGDRACGSLGGGLNRIPPGSERGVSFEIISEKEDGPGWEFGCQVVDETGSLRRHAIRLSWADYNLWSASGGDEPAHVAAAVVAFLLARVPAGELRESFDASIARRMFEEADREIPGLIRRA
jgi:hypothetical protein